MIGNAYADVRIGMEAALALDDAALRTVLAAMLGASARGEDGSTALRLLPGFLASRSEIYTVTDALESLTFTTTPPPNSPPLADPVPPPPPLSPNVPPFAPPAASTLLYWLIPVCIAAGLMLIGLMLINAFCIARLLGKPTARVGMTPSPGGDKVVVQGARARGRGLPRAKIGATSAASNTAAADDDGASHESSRDGSDASRESR